jgi:GT2 family glycosyltransferase
VSREALVTGVPVVGSNIGGIPEIVKHEKNGLLVEPGDVEGLHEALTRLCDEEGLLDRLRTGAADTPIRSLADDVGATRRLYQAHLATDERRGPGSSRVVSVVLNYRTPADTSIAVASLRASERVAEVIVVDNDAGVACRDALARWSGAVTYLQTGSNLGFAGGMNAGIRQALASGAQHVLLANSDVVVPPDCLGRLEAALREQSDVGIVGPVVRSRAFPALVASAGIDYNLRTGRMRARGAASLGGTGTMDGDVAAVSGCVMLVAREAFERVGLFDERYFFGFEDVDFCLRARAAGLRTRVETGAVAYHQGGAAIGAQSPRRLYFAARNHLMLAHAHAGGAGPMIRAARAALIMSLNLAYAVKAPGGSLPVRLGAALRGIRDYFRGRRGADAVDPQTI